MITYKYSKDKEWILIYIDNKHIGWTTPKAFEDEQVEIFKWVNSKEYKKIQLRAYYGIN